jgi:outer membrane protein OmpA-like peptidoglycan-associated protein
MQNYLKSIVSGGLAMGFVTLLGAAAVAGPLLPAPTTDEIIRALEPQLTRGLSAKPAGAAVAEQDRVFINSLRSKTAAGLSTDEREKLEGLAEKKPAIDLEMEFAYNSSKISGRSLQIAHNLGKALTAPQLKDKTFLLGGHTDAKGSDEYNRILSERRADSVKQFLVSHYQIKPETLLTAGYGKTHLKNPSDPLSPENRRVQTVTILP